MLMTHQNDCIIASCELGEHRLGHVLIVLWYFWYSYARWVNIASLMNHT